MFSSTEIPVLYKDIPFLFQAAQGTSETSANKYFTLGYFHREGLQKKPPPDGHQRENCPKPHRQSWLMLQHFYPLRQSYKDEGHWPEYQTPAPTSNTCGTVEHLTSIRGQWEHNSPCWPEAQSCACCNALERVKPKWFLALHHQNADNSAGQARDDSTLTALLEPRLLNESLRCYLALTNTQSIAQCTWILVALINCWKTLQSVKGTSSPLGPWD